MSLSSEPVELTVTAAETGCRLDAFLAAHFPDYSRVHLRRVIMAGGVKIDGRGGKPAYRLKPEQCVSICLPEMPRESPRPENIPLEILYEDEHVAVVNKPPGMVVHPARGHWSGTLASALQFHFGPTLSAAGGLSRPGIVHRLDRDTSGAILVARNDLAHAKLRSSSPPVRSRRSISRWSLAVRHAIATSSTAPSVSIRTSARRWPSATTASKAVPAQTFYETLERFDGFSAVQLQPKTGRTHQIRVHLNHIGCPVLCDRQYGGRSQITRGEIRRDPADELILLDRQALHARRLRFLHPVSGEVIEVSAPLPADIAAVLAELRKYRAVK